MAVQRAQCEAMAKATQVEVSQVFTDEGYSGKNLKRPAIAEIIDLADRGLIAGLIGLEARSTDQVTARPHPIG